MSTCKSLGRASLIIGSIAAVMDSPRLSFKGFTQAYLLITSITVIKYLTPSLTAAGAPWGTSIKTKSACNCSKTSNAIIFLDLGGFLTIGRFSEYDSISKRIFFTSSFFILTPLSFNLTIN
eukprot:Pompholyxophrys_punicea_v1_NODE_1225_length_852_cov_19.263488.p2 type:complete len:121 gc:universal NODE_1225_length_852_cov_19.263488:382-20(-)